MKKTFAPALIALLLLSACEEEAPPEAKSDGGEAAGEVLGGTISDDMIPLDELTSTSPPAEPLPEEETSVTRSVTTGADGETVIDTQVTTTTGEDGPPRPAPPPTPRAPPEQTATPEE